jgi:hypothetical protein
MNVILQIEDLDISSLWENRSHRETQSLLQAAVIQGS